MTPSADRTATIPLNSQTFLMTNIVPNRNDVSSDWRTSRMSVDVVEALISFDFFSNVENAVKNSIEGTVNILLASPAMKKGGVSGKAATVAATTAAAASRPGSGTPQKN